MNVLIVESSVPLTTVWQRHLERLGATVRVASTQDDACSALLNDNFDVIIMNLVIEDAIALAVSDLAQFRQPQARVMFVTSTTFFSDGSIFQLCPNACCYLPSGTEPEDIASLAQHYARAA